MKIEGTFNLDEYDLFAALMENTADSIYFKDRHCRIIRASRKMALALGFSDPSQLIGKTDIELFGEEFGKRTRVDDLRVMESGVSIVGLVEENQNKNGEKNWTSTTKLPLCGPTGKIIGLMGITREINDLKQKETRLEYIATHDLLTALPNRYLFSDRLEQTIRRAKRYQTSFAVLYLDMDHFKNINDRYGHDAGDRFLKQVSALLLEIVRDSDTVARLGGDEFAILIESIQDKEEACAIAERIITGFERWAAAGVTASIGISFYPHDGSDQPTLLKCADHAMYRAKEQTNTYRMFEHH